LNELIFFCDDRKIRENGKREKEAERWFEKNVAEKRLGVIEREICQSLERLRTKVKRRSREERERKCEG
jgi:hypothetical protein